MDILIRKAKKEDLKAVMEILSQIARLHHQIRPDLFKGDGTKFSESEFLEMIHDNNSPVFIAENKWDGRVTGYAFCRIEHFAEDTVRKAYKSLFLDDLCIDENERGTGTGTKMIEYLKSYAQSIKCHNLELNVMEGNQKAIAFYEKNGLTTQRRRMEWRLDNANDAI